MKAYIWKEEFQGHKIGEFALYGEDNFIDVWTNSDMNKMLKTEIPEELSLTPIHKLMAKYVASTTKMVPTTKVVPVLVPESTRMEMQENEIGEQVEVEVIVPEHYEDQVVVEEIEVEVPEHFEITINMEVVKAELETNLYNEMKVDVAQKVYDVFKTSNEGTALRMAQAVTMMTIRPTTSVGKIAEFNAPLTGVVKGDILNTQEMVEAYAGEILPILEAHDNYITQRVAKFYLDRVAL